MDSTRPISILLADNEEEVFVNLQKHLNSAPTGPYHLTWAPDYELALLDMACDAHDLYLVDCRIGHRSGIELLQEAARRGSRAPKILLTDLQDRGIDLESPQVGFSGEISKSDITSAALEVSIQTALRRTRDSQRPQGAIRGNHGSAAGSPEIIFRVDGAGDIQFINDAIRSLGFMPEQLSGKPILRLLAADSANEFIKECEKLSKQENSVRDLEVLLRSESGLPRRYALTLFGVFLNPSEPQAGSADYTDKRQRQFLGIQGIARDIGDQAETIDFLRRERDLIREFLDSSGAIFLLLDSQGRIAQINRTGWEILGYDRDELHGKDWFESCLPPDVRTTVRRVFDQLVSGSILFLSAYENMVLCRDGTERRVLWRATTLRGPDGRCQGVISSGIDVSDLRRTQAEREKIADIAEAREHLALLGEIAAGIAHEFRNPLHGVLNCVKILRSRIGGDPTLAQWLDAQEEGLRRMDTIADRLLRLGRHELGPLLPTNLSTLISDVLVLIRPRADVAGINIDVLNHPALPCIALDAQRIGEALLNLLTNSLDACMSGASITISTQTSLESKEFIELTVCDSGVGISAVDQKRVFEPFFTTKPVGKGSGLGLFLVKQVVEAHGGGVRLFSEPGKGTTVKLLLPVL